MTFFLRQACEPQFVELQNNSFQKAKEKLEMVNAVSAETIRLTAMSANLKDQLDLLMQKLMSNERKWEEIMMMQVRVIFYCTITFFEAFLYYLAQVFNNMFHVQ